MFISVGYIIVTKIRDQSGSHERTQNKHSFEKREGKSLKMGGGKKWVKFGFNLGQNGLRWVIWLVCPAQPFPPTCLLIGAPYL